MEPTWIDAPQGSLEWRAARIGCLTASRMKDALDYLKSGKPGAKRQGLLLDLMAEVFTGMETPVYVNGAMKWGTETEPQAREAYQEATGHEVTLCGFALHGEVRYFGASPDGLIGDDGLLEIKCPTSSTMVKWMLDDCIPEEHEPQLLAQLAVTGRQWVDFFAYDPRMATGCQFMLHRFAPGPERIAEVEAEARKVSEELTEMYMKITGRKS